MQSYAKVNASDTESAEVQGGNQDRADATQSDRPKDPDIITIDEPDVNERGQTPDPFQLDEYDDLTSTRTISAVRDPPPPYSPPQDPAKQRVPATRPVSKDVTRVQEGDRPPQRRRQPRPPGQTGRTSTHVSK